MNSIDYEDKIQNVLKYLKYLLVLIPVIVLFFVFKGCTSTNYSGVEDNLITAAKSYVANNNINVIGETYIEISSLGEIEGAELCSKGSGVVVKNNNGSLSYEAYLECDSYTSSFIDNKEKYIVLNGESVMLLNQGEAFNDPLYTLKKDANVIINGMVGTTAGVYTITYSAYVDNKLKETATRKVIVVKSDKTTNISGLENTEYPSLTLEGDKNMILALGTKYVEPGYRAVDYTDGKISRQVEIVGKVNTNSLGVYTLTYKIANSKGNSTIAVRIVTVVQKKANLIINASVDNETITNKVVITLNVTGDDFEQTVKPNGEKTSFRTTTYTTTSNGLYTFKVYDSFGNEFIKEVDVSNIDSIPPSGTCKAITTSNNTKVEVNAIDNKGVSGYSYILNGSATEFQTFNTYEASINSKTVQVKVKDLVGNTSTLNCEVEEKTLISKTTCNYQDLKVNIKTCFGDETIRSGVDFEEYLMGVVYGEEDPDTTDSMEYIKAFIIFARTYSLRRGGYSNHPTYLNLRSCSSDQNWCDINQGCYRYQTESMFDSCINYSLNSKQYSSDGQSPYYTAETCANRVTTFPGSLNVSNQTYYVNNSGWPSNYASSATSSHNVSSWKSSISAAKRALIEQAIAETAGLVVKTSDGSIADIGYYMCDRETDGRIMCPNTAEILANTKGYTAEELILAYTQNYTDIKVDCYK